MQEKKDLEKLLRAGIPVGFKPQGSSMHPTIVQGRDSVIVEPIGNRKLKRGDVALYRRDCNASSFSGQMVLHRVCKVKKDGIYMVGDNEKTVEGPLRNEQFFGIMTELIRKDKHISVKNLRYRIITGLWLFLRPIRFVIVKPFRIFRKG